jgi:pilus assembly protein CpaE
LNRQEIEAAIARVTAKAAPISGQVIAFIGAKGGVGTTTLAVNTATALARKARNGTLLLDLNVRFGDAAAYLGVEPRFTVADALENAHRLDEAFIRGLVVRTPGGLDLLAAPERLPGQGVDLERLRALLNFCKKQFGFTVVDVPRTDTAMLEALDSAAHVIVVVSQELTAVRSATRLVKALRQRYGTDHVKVILGRSDNDAEIAPEDLEKALGAAVRVFPNDYRRALEALNRGRPLVLENHCKLAGELQRFVKELTGVTEPEPAHEPRGGLFSKWLKGGSPS